MRVFRTQVGHDEYTGNETSPSRVYFLAIAFTLITLLQVHLPFLIGSQSYYHDSVVPMINCQLFFDRFFRGELPLWNPYQNGGEALWVSVEAFHPFDPVSVLVWGFGFFFHINPALLFQWNCFLWLSIFAAGGVACARNIYRNRWVSLLVFAFLMLGPIAKALPAQSCGFLLPFRYIPWVIWSFYRLENQRTLKRSFEFGVWVGLSAAGFQSVFNLVAIVSFIFFYYLFNFLSQPKKSKQTGSLSFTQCMLASAAVATPFWLTTLISCASLPRYVSLAREYIPSHFVFSSSQIFPHMTDLLASVNPWHGQIYIGILPLSVAILALHTAALKPFTRLKSLKKLSVAIPPLELTWIAATLFLILLSIDTLWNTKLIRVDLLGVRNWGFLFGAIVLCLLQVAVVGARILYSESNGIYLLQVSTVVVSYLVFPFYKYSDTGARFWLLLIPLTVGTLIWSSVARIKSSKAKETVGIILCMLSLADLFHFALNKKWGTHPMGAVLNENIPLMGQTNRSRINYRRWSMDESVKLPIYYNAPALRQEAVAFSPPLLRQAGPNVHEQVTHHLRTKEYQKLLDANLPSETLEVIFGISMPLVSLVPQPQIVLAKNFEDAINKMREMGSENLKSKAILQADSLPNFELTPNSAVGNSTSTWSINSHSPHEISYQVVTTIPTVLVYSDSYTNDWNAYIDGQQATLYRANGIFKGVMVPPGKHEVRFAYLPLWYIFSFWFRAASLAIAAGYLLWSQFGVLVTNPVFNKNRLSVIQASRIRKRKVLT